MARFLQHTTVREGVVLVIREDHLMWLDVIVQANGSLRRVGLPFTFTQKGGPDVTGTLDDLKWLIEQGNHTTVECSKLSDYFYYDCWTKEVCHQPNLSLILQSFFENHPGTRVSTTEKKKKTNAPYPMADTPICDDCACRSAGPIPNCSCSCHRKEK